MARPPREPEDFDQVIGQVSDALDELEVVHGPDREALLGSLREVLGALGGLPGASVEVHTRIVEPELEIPVVRVVEGGRSDDDEGPGSGPRPDLRLASEDCTDPDSASVDVESAFLSLGALPGRRRKKEEPVAEPPGSIHLVPAAEAEAVQIVFAGVGRRTYRVRCLSGKLAVEADGAAVGSLWPGQTVDVEARQVQVRAAVPSEGRYIRLRS